ncbi:MAG: DUF454 domain-containing protein [Candidatus Competibacteraceae bacterium]|nr:DUF454 domain-containing protein [Candidatus Competibacteraceae bacterium]
MNRILWFIGGCFALACGVVGAVLPLLPTTPFLLLATFAFARSSPRLYAWITEHPRFGPPINDWHAQGAIGRNAKVTAVTMMVATLAMSAALGVAKTILIIQLVVLTCSAAFILSRPVPARCSVPDANI